ncbi:MAG: hypothetical protein D3M94_10590 [Rhodocyclales bacterium GT-UBC]|nr:MAG: hypothetical protein D3M94_10590 [Rhodocyclales bacterium GT-UBC]
MNLIQKLVSVVGFLIRVWKIFDNLWLNWGAHDYLGAFFNLVMILLLCLEKRDYIKALGGYLKTVRKFVTHIPSLRSISNSIRRKDDPDNDD